MQDEYDSHYVRVKYPPSRLVGKREVFFTCQRCHADVTEWRYPGPMPKYCFQCGPLVEAERSKARVSRLRAERKQHKDVTPT